MATRHRPAKLTCRSGGCCANARMTSVSGTFVRAARAGSRAIGESNLATWRICFEQRRRREVIRGDREPAAGVYVLVRWSVLQAPVCAERFVHDGEAGDGNPGRLAK